LKVERLLVWLHVTVMLLYMLLYLLLLLYMKLLPLLLLLLVLLVLVALLVIVLLVVMLVNTSICRVVGIAYVVVEAGDDMPTFMITLAGCRIEDMIRLLPVSA